MLATADRFISSVPLATRNNRSIHLQIGVAKSEKEIVDTHALLDSGAEGTFIDNRFVD
jgi:hypothetical protein